MKVNRKRSAVVLALLIAVIFLCMTVANGIQTDHGNVSVSIGSIETSLGDMTYKLYTPSSASAENPAPAVLMLHGYQNDRETCAAYSIELARRGIVVMALDEFGHGGTEVGLINRGYVNHKVTVNYGNDSEADGTFVEIGGQNRYKLMMNFSNLSFFDEHYTKGSDGSELTDSSAGGIAAYAVLADMDFVDSANMAVSGHSMGTWSSWSVAAAYSGTDIEPRATVLQCGELFRNSVYDTDSIHFNNVLLLQAKYDEFSYFRDYEMNVSDELLKTPLRCEFLGTDADSAAWNTTFGSFEDGSARRMELLNTNHRLTTHNEQGLATALDWFASAFGIGFVLDSHNQVAMVKEALVLVAMLCAMAATIPVMTLLMGLPFFAEIEQPLPSRDSIKSKGNRWKGAVITMLLAGGSYPFMTQLGHGLLPLPEGVFRMTVGNGFVSYYGLLIIIMLVTIICARASAKKKGVDSSLYNRGLATAEKPEFIGWALFAKCLLLALCMTGAMYILVAVCEKLFMLDFRFIWPFFKSFTADRALQFCVYILIFLLFFILSQSNAIAFSRSEAAYEPGFKGFMACWWRNALIFGGGIILVALLEYIPFFAGAGPGADLLFGFTFGGPFMSLLILFLPQVLIYSILGTIAYRRTGSIYTGASATAIMACWIVTGGSSIL